MNVMNKNTSKLEALGNAALWGRIWCPRRSVSRHAARLGSSAAFALTVLASFARADATAPAAASAPPQPPPAADKAPARVERDEPAENWAERDQRLGESNTLAGGVGLLRTQHAQSGAPGQFRLALVFDYFGGGFLCSDAYPCKSPKGGALLSSDSSRSMGGALSAGVSLLRVGGGTLEGYGSIVAQAASSDASGNGLIEAHGDTNLGLRLDGPLARVLHAGALAELQLVNGLGSVGPDGAGTSARFGPLVTADLRELESQTPLRFSANVLYTLENRGQLVTDTEAARGTSITRAERFGLNVNRLDHLDLHFGAEWLAASGRVRPFAEYLISVPVQRQDYFCRPKNPSSDGCLALDKLAPSKLTVGGRFFPWRGGFSLLAAVDIGVTGTKSFIEEVPPTPPWTVFVGAGGAYDTVERPGRVETANAGVAKVRGFVHEQGKNEGIGSAIVAWESHPEWTSLATSSTGRFATNELAAGEYRFKVTAEGYKDGGCAAKVAGPARDVDLDCPLEALARVGTIVGTVRDTSTLSPIANVAVKLVDATGSSTVATADAAGLFHFEGIEPGAVRINVDLDGFLPAVVSTEARARAEAHADVHVRKRPGRATVAVGPRELQLTETVQFAGDAATPSPASFELLQEVADALLHAPHIKRLEVQAHTDNMGTAERNRALSDERATAVRSWLVAHGVPQERLIAHGYGQTRPLVPNITDENRARNRRVQFVILDQDGSAPGASAPDVRPAATSKGKPGKAAANPAAPSGFPTAY